ncbi:GDSL-type esterase/lipase family protein [Oribacterium sp. FC2011]|uniref:GDSL-type esterase/lipase family protein n=1 Tax=Oribacterium sp. FC2011 TaxID=1408311 RepID=UPI0004E1068A|nr:GDSL-type esterase/lipase family protein [Oribacterium sp. FC2011]
MKKLLKKAAIIALASSMIVSSGIISMAEETAAAQETQAATELSQDPVVNAQEDQRVVDFYKDSLIIGDSVADGFRRYAIARSANPILANLKFITMPSYSMDEELKPIGTEGVRHLWYGGAQHYAYEMVGIMGAKHVYISLGLNDIQGRPSEVFENYKTYIGQIKAANPDVDITIISTTYIYSSHQSSIKGVKSWAFDNDTVRKLNASMQEYAAQNGYGYIDIANRLADANGNLNPVYCTDQKIHQNDDAYAIWVQCLREYAAAQNYVHANDAAASAGETATTETTAAGSEGEVIPVVPVQA